MDDCHLSNITNLGKQRNTDARLLGGPHCRTSNLIIQSKKRVWFFTNKSETGTKHLGLSCVHPSCNKSFCTPIDLPGSAKAKLGNQDIVCIDKDYCYDFTSNLTIKLPL